MSANDKDLKSPLNQVIDFSSSVQVAVTLLVLSALATLIGSVLPQETTIAQADLINDYAGSRFDFLNALGFSSGEARYEFMNQLGLNNVFFSTWYLFLMLCLYVSITAASFKRVFPKAKYAFRWHKMVSIDAALKFPFHKRIKQSELTKDIGLDELKLFLKSKFYAIKEVDSGSFLAMRGSIHKLGASLTHVGIILLITGACYGMLTGFGGFTTVAEGELFKLRQAEIKRVQHFWMGKVPDLQVLVHKVWKESYDDGTPKQYYSDLELYNSKNELIKGHLLKVNHPLKHDDFYLYQNTYAEYLTVRFNDKIINNPIERLADMDVSILKISDDFSLLMTPMIAEDGLEFMSVFAVKRDGQEEQSSLVAMVQEGDSIDLGTKNYPVRFEYVAHNRITGLSYKSNPGQPMIIVGFIILILGVFLAFGAKRQIGVILEPETRDLIVYGIADKFQNAFVRDLSKALKNFSTKYSA